MRESLFRAFLSRQVSQRVVADYVSRCRRVEALLRLDLDACDLSEAGVANIRNQLRREGPRAGMTEGSLANCLTAVRRYAEFRLR